MSNREQVLLGSLLGDGCIIVSYKKYFSYREEHCIAQKDYLLWKNTLLRFNFNKHSKTSGFNKGTSVVSISKQDSIFGYYRDMFYSNGKKTVAKEILDKLEPLGIAVWFMDDGCYLYAGNSINIATCAFTFEEHKLIQNWFNERWGIGCKIRQGRGAASSKIYYYIHFNAENTKKFISLVSPYIIPSMRYKTGGDEIKRQKRKEYDNLLKQKRYPAHKDEKAVYNKRYYHTNRIELIAHVKQYYQENKIKVLAWHKQQRKTHKTELAAYHKQHYEQNRERILAQHKIRRRGELV